MRNFLSSQVLSAFERQWLMEVACSFLLNPGPLHCQCVIASEIESVVSSQVTHVITTGEWSSSQLATVLELGAGGCLQLGSVMKQTLQDALTQ